MCRRGTLSRNSYTSGSAIPQPMPLPQVPIGVLCLSTRNLGKADITRRRRITSLMSDIPTKKIAPSKAIFLFVIDSLSLLSRSNAFVSFRLACFSSRYLFCLLLAHSFLLLLWRALGFFPLCF